MYLWYIIVYVVLTHSIQIVKPSVVEDLTVIMTIPYQLTNCKVLKLFFTINRFPLNGMMFLSRKELKGQRKSVVNIRTGLQKSIQLIFILNLEYIIWSMSKIDHISRLKAVCFHLEIYLIKICYFINCINPCHIQFSDS